MPRSRENVRKQLQDAALELYYKHGYDKTTTAEIANRAGVTERTFFRHFADKREVLFDGETILVDALTLAIANAPTKLKALDVLMFAYRSTEQLLVKNRGFSVPRQKVIAKTPALQERVQAKIAMLTSKTAVALEKRGFKEKQAVLAAQVGTMIFNQAASVWLDESSLALSECLERAYEELRALLTGPKRKG